MNISQVPINKILFDKQESSYPPLTKLPPAILQRSGESYKVILGNKVISSLPPQTTNVKCVILPEDLLGLKRILINSFDNPRTSKIALGCVISLLIKKWGVYPRTLGSTLKIKASVVKSLSNLAGVHEDLWVIYESGQLRWQKVASIAKHPLAEQEKWLKDKTYKLRLKKKLTVDDIAHTPTISELRGVLDYCRLNAKMGVVSEFAQLLVEYIEGKACASYIMSHVEG